MKNSDKAARWKRRYQTALRRYLKQELPANLQSAGKLGQEAAALGLETLDVALIHKKTLNSIAPDDSSARTRKQSEGQAERFFAETVIPIEKTHGASLEAAARVCEVKQVLHTRNADLTASARRLEQSSIKRRKAETALDLSEKKRRKLDRESKTLNVSLRKKTREILLKQEQKNRKTSIHLQDEVAQTLLALDLRLLALKTAVEANTQKISNELDDTQQMVRKSLRKIGSTQR